MSNAHLVKRCNITTEITYIQEIMDNIEVMD